jgi:DNA polymerase-3 subunit delta
MESDGKGAQAAMAGMRPPVFFSRQKLVEGALARWDLDAFARILSRLQTAVLESRKRPDLAEAIVRQAFIAAISERAGRRSR